MKREEMGKEECYAFIRDYYHGQLIMEQQDPRHEGQTIMVRTLYAQIKDGSLDPQEAYRKHFSVTEDTELKRNH